ncbi:MAG: type II secretion system F family protein [Elusimicrobia bacterium]|nr:type II secretion system F family protein [Candidatus Obscuribacterium magneticum]
MDGYFEIILVSAGAGVGVLAIQAFYDWQREIHLHKKWAEAGFKKLRPSWNVKYNVVGLGSIAGALAFLLFLPQETWLSLLGGILGGGVPLYYWREERRRRQWKNYCAFPDFLELIAMALRAGLVLEKAWELALRYMPPSPLKDELEKSYRHFSSGQSRDELFERLLKSLNDERLSPALRFIAQSMSQGLPLQSVLLEQADILRTSVYLSLEKRAQTASIRMLFPIVFLIFPSLFLILFGSIALQFALHGGLF